MPSSDEPFHHVDHERRLVEIARRDERAHRLALALPRPQVLAEAASGCDG
jgi:hypothetical protein